MLQMINNLKLFYIHFDNTLNSQGTDIRKRIFPIFPKYPKTDIFDHFLGLETSPFKPYKISICGYFLDCLVILTKPACFKVLAYQFS